ncbi:hypothetical protein A1OW_15455 [Enterovibrio norvegicus]|uniref:hypothetical protein n=1 Tax=Enterovibrio norvegicus TaxID=188144 RepID=UPI0002D26501|nr:hypothetical protein [Enterovibrio norvegicus]OEF48529.1 hypothetical protein A1OW_15455 [Enterovibrio norvegicus]
MLKLSAVIMSLALVSGCSTIVSESSYPVSISSSPSQADFVLVNRDGQQVHTGTTPDTVTLNASSGFFKGETYQLILNKDGYEEKTIEIESTVDGWYFGNILFGGLIGMLIVDPATGAMFKLPEGAEAQLDEKAVHASTVTIAMIDAIPEEQRASLIQVK